MCMCVCVFILLTCIRRKINCAHRLYHLVTTFAGDAMFHNGPFSKLNCGISRSILKNVFLFTERFHMAKYVSELKEKFSPNGPVSITKQAATCKS